MEELISDSEGQAEQRPLVETKYGRLEGVTLPVKETPRTVDAFFGIPFAKPPVGPLRFANPEAPEPWKSIRDASKYPPVCLQYPAFNAAFTAIFKSSFQSPPTSEDCLYLNVFTPSDRQKGLRLPVMVFIHGGALFAGGASLYDGSALSVFEDVVVVAIQYRLGVLGYFSTGDDQLRGNLGFFDQVAALHWVKENVADFGGDPQSVTIFGESAGGISVTAHVLSPLSKGLFHRAISESGTMKMPGLVVTKSESLIVYREIISKLFSCEPSSVVECLMLKSEDEILEGYLKMGALALPACVDGVFMPKPAEEILANKQSNDVPLLLGVCNHDAAWLLPQGQRSATTTPREMEDILSKLFHIDGISDDMNRASVEKLLLDVHLLELNSSHIPAVLDYYIAGVKEPSQFRDRSLDIFGDRTFAIPALSTAKYHRDSGHPVYLYEFQHRPSIFANVKPDYVKADHADDLIYVFGGPFLRDGLMFAGEATDEEKLLSRTIMRYWANFARNGDPNGPGLVEWPQYDAEERHLEIDLKPKASAKLKEDKFQFWTKILHEKTKREDHPEL
ncbi:fatty acyl-CoA hydrolase precursor, medium chain-like [Gastrophryne carolinensis]